MSEPIASIPPITMGDISWVTSLMGLRDLDGARLDFLKRLTTVDVSACPGSGKTTLVVAKLALLARRWPWRTRGICVLSHTNVAREEIEKRLGPTSIGQRLSGYPHITETIHGFLGRFLALPFLRSRRMTFLAFDDDLTNRARRRFLGRDAGRLDFFLSKRQTSIESLRINNVAFELNQFPAGPSTEMFKLAQAAVRHAAENGYFCFSDIFMLSEAILAEVPTVADALRQRFPVVLLDEMQDTDNQQGRILGTIFPRCRPELCIQRVGDPNQAIYEEDADCEEIGFPDSDPERFLSLPKSFRFGKHIATCASPIAVAAVGTDGLQGLGPGTHLEVDPSPTILLFPDDNPQSVLPAFGELVLSTFTDAVLDNGRIVGVAAVQKAIPNPDDKKFPQSLSQYWDGYDPSVSRKTNHLATFVEYVLRARGLAAKDSTWGAAVNELAQGLLHLVRLQSGSLPGGWQGRGHRRILDQLDDCQAASYKKMVVALLDPEAAFSVVSWAEFRAGLAALAISIVGQAELQPSALAFLCWPSRLREGNGNDGQVPSTGNPNVYRHTSGTRTVNIHLGSIHSVKGETHLATLILEVFNYRFFFSELQAQLRNSPPKKKPLGVWDMKHRRLAYVAMTRPTHLLCIAMRNSTLGEGAEAKKRIEELEAQGWCLQRIVVSFRRACAKPSGSQTDQSLVES